MERCLLGSRKASCSPHLADQTGRAAACQPAGPSLGAKCLPKGLRNVPLGSSQSCTLLLALGGARTPEGPDRGPGSLRGQSSGVFPVALLSSPWVCDSPTGCAFEGRNGGSTRTQ